ncbi:hypothetical protein IPMB12_06185 [Zophobihabitans entericus]|uniref:Pilus assembly protein CpaE n=2 Tax=Zophobihabitans entericus TaxID=1635327 RepID=A0A6G9ICJ9_9GAMM|nr:hypothetical protein IPMB12_06185 [Zophobihabitans entericus]
MKLFGDVSTEEKKDDPWKDRIEGKISLYKVAIVSENPERVERLKSILVLYNIVRIQVFEINFALLKDEVELDEFDVILIDIDTNDDVEFISAYLTQYIPVNSIAYVIGSNDSISFAHELEKKGIKYLLNDVQIDNLPMLLWQGKNEIQKRQGNIITFLGCKGGVGTSQLAYHTVKAISRISKIPMLLVQGGSGSFDMDFIVEKPIEKDGSIVELDDNLSVRIEPSKPGWDFKDDSIYKFNLVVFDHNLNSILSVPQLNNVFAVSNTVIVVINRDPYSIKVAKSILEERNRIIMRDDQLADKRFFICLNDNKPFNKKEMLADEDIAEFLEHPIDIKQGYFASNKKLQEAHTSKEVKSIATLLIGISESPRKLLNKLTTNGNKKKKSKFSLFKSKSK